MSGLPATFDEERADAYDERIRRLAPGYDVLHDAVASLAGSMLETDAQVLVVGAGTGTEIVTLARAHPGWGFTAVDPSAEMLNRCRETVEKAGLGARVEYVCDRVEDLSAASCFDGATSVFVSHFLQDPGAKQRFFRAIARQLRSGAPLLLADLFGNASDDALMHLKHTSLPGGDPSGGRGPLPRRQSAPSPESSGRSRSCRRTNWRRFWSTLDLELPGGFTSATRGARGGHARCEDPR